MLEKLSEETYKHYPLADSSCRICHLPIEEIKKLHNLKFQEGYSYDEILNHLKSHYNVSLSMSTIFAHFTKHTMEGQTRNLHESLDLSVAHELEHIAIDKNEANADNLQTAYAYLTKTCMELAQNSASIIAPFMEELKNMSPEKIKEKADRMSPLNALEQMARIQKIISEHVHTISQMRAPKVVVAQFMDLAINEVIRQTSQIFAEACKNVETSITNELKEKRMELGSLAFKRAFSESIKEFKSAMLELKRDQLFKVTQVLSEIEKIV